MSGQLDLLASKHQAFANPVRVLLALPVKSKQAEGVEKTSMLRADQVCRPKSRLESPWRPQSPSTSPALLVRQP